MEITCRVYRPRRARDTPLFRLVEQHLEEFLRVYEERFAKAHGPLRPGWSGCSGPSSHVGSSSAGTSSHNRYYHCVTRTPSEVKVTRRHHPLQGQSLEVLHTGPRQLIVRAPDGVPMRLPRAWTDADGATEAVAEGAVFSVDAIRAVVERVEALQRRRVLDVIEAGGACLVIHEA